MLPKEWLRDLAICPHGTANRREMEQLGLSPQDILDFSVNSNPFGPSPRVALALTEVDVARYPDSEAIELRQVLARKLGVAMEQIIVANGSVELIWLLALAYIRPGDTVLISGPTFGEYERVSRITNARVIEQRARVEDAFRPDLDQTLRLIRREKPRLVFLCNPNNPTGVYLERGRLETLLAACEDSLLVLDEAYINFVENHYSTVDLIEHSYTCLLRSLTKDYALAGLRLGYILANSRIIGALRKVCPPWNVNAAAQVAGIAALQDDEHLESACRAIEEAKRYLMYEITALGLRVLPTAANFFLVEVGDATLFRSALLKRGCCVRDCTSFGLPRFIRIGIRTQPECERLVTAIKEVQILG
ncbi:MAG: histidinol-phosphate transaminase [Chloroflexi bacterium]|nr:histidinol-phosphate transaminase [Chloroflexota bacterium]